MPWKEDYIEQVDIREDFNGMCCIYSAIEISQAKKVVEDDGVSENEYDENLGEESGAKIILESTFLYMKTAGDHRYRYGRQALVI